MAHTRNLTGAEMTALWLQYQAAEQAYSAAIHIQDNGTPETEAAFARAQRAIMDAHTVDLLGIAIKLTYLDDVGGGDEVIDGILQDLAIAGVVPPRHLEVRQTEGGAA